MSDFTLQNQTVPKPANKLTHTECVELATDYLGKRCNVVLPEFFCWNGELADVIGFKSRNTVLIECKVSRGDFLADKKKHHRIWPEQGMGDYRYYCCPKGLISKSELPEGWGLLYVYPSGNVRQVVDSKRFEKSVKAEHHLLFYYAKRAVEANVHNVILSQRTGL